MFQYDKTFRNYSPSISESFKILKNFELAISVRKQIFFPLRKMS